MPSSLGTSIVVVAIVFSVVAAIAVGLRFHCRKLKKVGYGTDDWLIVLALLFAISMGIANCLAVFYARLGEHVLLGPNGVPIHDESMVVFSKIAYTSQVLNVPCFAFAKLSILFLYRRIFRGAVFSLITWILIAISAAWGVIFVVTTILQCVPIELNWTTSYFAPRSCLNISALYVAKAASDFIIDLAILCIPGPNIWKLHLPTGQKLTILSIFMLGGFVCGISVTRFVICERAAIDLSAESVDILSGYGAPTIYWGQLEGAFAVISACLPTLRPLFAGFFRQNIFENHGRQESKAASSKTTLRRLASFGGNGTSVHLYSFSSSQQGAKEISEYVPEGNIRVEQELDLSFTEKMI